MQCNRPGVFRESRFDIEHNSEALCKHVPGRIQVKNVLAVCVGPLPWTMYSSIIPVGADKK